MQFAIKQIIPPKGIRRKNFEGQKFIEACDKDEEKYGERATDDESESETSEDEESPSDQPSVVVLEKKGSHGIASLQNLCDDPEINKDAVFLDEFQKVLETNGTSTLFKLHLNKMKATFFEAPRNLKKRTLQRYNCNKGRVNKSSREEILWTGMITTYSHVY